MITETVSIHDPLIYTVYPREEIEPPLLRYLTIDVQLSADQTISKLGSAYLDDYYRIHIPLNISSQPRGRTDFPLMKHVAGSFGQVP